MRSIMGCDHRTKIGVWPRYLTKGSEVDVNQASSILVKGTNIQEGVSTLTKDFSEYCACYYGDYVTILIWLMVTACT